MTPLHWQDASQKGTPEKRISASGPSPSSSATNPWFAVSMGLMGLIVGFGIGKWRSGALPIAAGNPPAQIAQVPTAPTPPAQAPQPPAPTANPAKPDDDPVLGKDDAPVTLIEFVDYQCPFCKRFFDQTFSQLKTEYVDTGKVKIVMRDFPLSFHQNAQKASETTECAEEGGKFWKMHDLLFQKQDEWASSSTANDLFKQYAASLGLGKTFDSCLDTGKYAQEVQKDLSDGTTAGINGTPGFWVIGKDGKGQQISGAVPFSNFKTVIDSLLGSAGKAEAAAPSGETRIISLTSENWKFTPTVIKVKKGEKVTLKITGVSGIHGFGVPGLGINVPVQPGETATIDLPTDKTGSFPFLCTIPCGSGHSQMTGQVVIE